jgi:hypothetical protein
LAARVGFGTKEIKDDTAIMKKWRRRETHRKAKVATNPTSSR